MIQKAQEFRRADYYNPAEVAELFGISDTTVLRWARDDPEFPRAIRVTRKKLFFRRREVDRFLAERINIKV